MDAEAKRLTTLILPIETHLKTEEAKVINERQRIEQEAVEAKRVAGQARVDALLAVGLSMAFDAVAALGDDEYLLKLATATADHQAAQQRAAAEAAKRQAESDRLAAELCGAGSPAAGARGRGPG